MRDLPPLEPLARMDERLRQVAMLTEELAESRGIPFEDFALQHLGKALADAGHADEAVDALERALALRREKGDSALVESTKRALERASALLRQP